jgi:hypothetical protein
MQRNLLRYVHPAPDWETATLVAAMYAGRRAAAHHGVVAWGAQFHKKTAVEAIAAVSAWAVKSRIIWRLKPHGSRR